MQRGGSFGELGDKSISTRSSFRTSCGSGHLQIKQVNGGSLLGQSIYGICSLMLISLKENGQPGGTSRESGLQSPRMSGQLKGRGGGVVFLQRLPHDFPFLFIIPPARVVGVFFFCLVFRDHSSHPLLQRLEAEATPVQD